MSETIMANAISVKQQCQDDHLVYFKQENIYIFIHEFNIATSHIYSLNPSL